jgi:hypothetical protein
LRERHVSVLRAPLRFWKRARERYGLPCRTSAHAFGPAGIPVNQATPARALRFAAPTAGDREKKYR